MVIIRAILKQVAKRDVSAWTPSFLRKRKRNPSLSFASYARKDVRLCTSVVGNFLRGGFLILRFQLQLHPLITQTDNVASPFRLGALSKENADNKDRNFYLPFGIAACLLSCW